jgi:hypothetical protein
MESSLFRAQIQDVTFKLQYLLNAWDRMTDEQQDECMECTEANLKTISRLLKEFDLQPQHIYTDCILGLILSICILCMSKFMGLLSEEL